LVKGRLSRKGGSGRMVIGCLERYEAPPPLREPMGFAIISEAMAETLCLGILD